MKLWLVTQDEATGYDTYDAMVVAAATEADARAMHPAGYAAHEWDGCSTWCSSPDKAKVECLGDADGAVGPGVILASFNAG